MNALKIALFTLMLSCFGLWAQTPPTNNTPAAQDEKLRQALRQAMKGRSNTAAAVTAARAAAGMNPATAENPAAIGTRTVPLTGGAPVTSPGPGAVDNAVARVARTPEAAAAAVTNAPAEETVPPGLINFQKADLPQVLQFYAELVNRTILSPASLPAPLITLKTQTPLTRREAVQALDAVLGMNGIAMVNIGDKFVKVVPEADAGKTGAPLSTNVNISLPDLGPLVNQVVHLKYVKPADVTQVLQGFSKAPNGVVAIGDSQILVLRDYSENVKRMLEIIKEIDVLAPTDFVSEVIPIKYAIASDIASALNSLSSGGGGGTTVGSGSRGTSGGSRGGFGSGGFGQNRSGFGSSGYGSSYGGSSYGSGFGSPYGGVNPMSESVTPMAAGVAPVAGAGGSSFTDRLRGIINRAANEKEIQVLGQTKIIADERTNSLLVYANKDDMKIIKDIVSKLDVVLAQVLIEAVIIEVTLGPDSKDVGVSWLQHPQTSGKFTGVGSAGAGQFLNPSDFVSGAASGATNAAGSLAGGFNYLGTWNNDLDVTLTAIQSDSRAKVLQRPTIQTSHAVPANLFVGESRPYPTASYYGGGAYGGYSSIQQMQIGVSLDVTPLINPDGLVVMDIHQKIDSVAGQVDIANVGSVPITSSKEAQAKVAVRDRDTIMLGGLIENDKSDSRSGVPILMNIPVLGYLFRSTSTSQTRKELIVLIRPTVLPTPEVAALAATAQKRRMPGVRRAEREVEQEETKRLDQAEREERRSGTHPQPYGRLTQPPLDTQP